MSIAQQQQPSAENDPALYISDDGETIDATQPNEIQNVVDLTEE